MKQQTIRRFIPVTQWHEYHPWPPIGGLRHLIFHAESTGFDRVLKRVGRRILLDEQAFFEWLDAAGPRERGDK